MAASGTSLNPPAVRRFLQIVLLLLLLFAGIGGRYLYHRGLTRPWREWVVAEIRKHGVEMEIGRLTVRPFRGLVAKDVVIYDSPARNRVLARVNGMVVEANYANAARGRAFLDALTLVDTNLRIPLDPKQPGGPSVDVANLNARILFPPNQIHVSHLEADVLGIHLRAGGSLTIPADAAMFRDNEGANAGKFARLINEVRALRFEGGPPDLTIRFSGDTGQPQSILVEAELSGQKIRRGKYSLASLAVAANWQNNMLLVSRLDAADSVGRLQASGSFEPKSRTANLRVRSGLDLPALARAFELADLGDISFRSAPQLELTARFDLGDTTGNAKPKFQVLGHTGAGKFSYGGVPFESLSADVSWDGLRWAVRDFAVVQEDGGRLTGDAQQDFDAAGTGDFRLSLTSSLSPQKLAPLLGPDARAQLAQVKFHEPPRITLSARGTAPGPGMISAAGDLKLARTTFQGADTSGATATFRYNGRETSGTLKLGRTTFHGIDASSAETTFRYAGSEASGTLKVGRTIYRGMEARDATTTFRYDGRVLALDGFEVNRAEGSGKGALSLDLKTGIYTLKDVRTSLHPAEVALWIDPDLVHDIKPYRFGKKPPLLRLDGTIDPRKGGKQTKLTVIADAPGGMDYTFVGKELHFGEAKGRLFFTDERLKLSDTRAELFGGKITGDADISILKAKPGHNATLQLSGVNFAKLSKLYFDYDDSEGKLDAAYSFSGKGDEGRTMRGEGEVTVTDGKVFAIPFLGPFSEILNKIVPGMGYNRAHKASMTFGIAEGIITTKNFLITGKGFSMMGGGRIWFLDDKMDFDIRINAQGLPGVLFFPVSKLLEYRAASKFSKPEWRPKIIPRINVEKTR